MQSSMQYLAAAASSLWTTTLSPSVTMRSASTVDKAVEAACVGDSHGAQTPVSAISRGRRGRWWRAAARTAAVAAALRNPGDRFVWVMYGFYLELAVESGARFGPT